MAALAEAGVEVVGENRAQDLEAKHARYGDAFRWHFIGHLQSRTRRRSSTRSASSCTRSTPSPRPRRLTVPALVEVNLSGEPSKSGIAPEELPRSSSAPATSAGLMTMPPLAGDPEASRPYFRAPARARRAARPARALDGHEPGLPRRRRGGRDPRPCGLASSTGKPNHSRRRWASQTSGTGRSSTSASPRRTTTGTRTATSRTRSSSGTLRASARTSAGCAARAAREREFDDWTDLRRRRPPTTARVVPAGAARRAHGRRLARASTRSPWRSVRVHLVVPRSFNDAQQIADKFKEGIPVILNLQGSDAGALEAPDRLRQRADLRARRRHAARRRQGLPADAAQRRGVRRGAGAPARARRLLQPA